MKSRPILFSGSMVRAILSGVKCQTRRVVKFKNHHTIEQRNDGQDWPWMYDSERDADWWMPCPYGQPGDQLWVREAFRLARGYDKLSPTAVFSLLGSGEIGIHYESDGPAPVTAGKIRPSIHMPRWASRITLEVTGVRVERLWKISEADAIAEGAPLSVGPCTEPEFQSHTLGYMQLWDGINGAGSWRLNPWVWVIEFRRVEA
jgi:hypothetical protein